MKNINFYYIDTSVFGGYFDKEFFKTTCLFWSQAKEGRFRLLISDLVGKELEKASEPVRNLLMMFSTEDMMLIQITEEMDWLADEYVKTGIVYENYRDDALHVAAATLSPAKALVSWNFRHLVNIRREEGFNGVNLLKGYRQIRIVSPTEVIEYEE
ncbi:MAG: PIN domain nuclease [Candidatus Omnitrophota bacterium]